MPSALARAGIGRERRMAMLLLDTVDFPIAFWGALRAGVVPVPINTLLTHDTVGYILADSRAEALVDLRSAGGAAAAGAAAACRIAADRPVAAGRQRSAGGR